MRAGAAAAALAACLLGGCPGPEDPPVEPIFPEDYATTWTMVRDCRRSVDHDLSFVQVWANPLAEGPYLSREGTLPDGAVLLKEEFADEDCTDRIGWTAMRREAGFMPRAGDWHWQEATFDREVINDGNLPECFLCHESCGVAPDGFDWTCAVP